MVTLYHDLILDHYRNPRNHGVLKAATHSGKAKNPTCGDSLHMDMDIDRDVIAELRFTGSGCAISQASASLVTDFVRGKSVQEALALGPETVLRLLGITLSPARLKCGLLSLEALKRSLQNKRSDPETTVDPNPIT